eukprot:1863122-Pleurochrysis_carterae.AAC.1
MLRVLEDNRQELTSSTSSRIELYESLKRSFSCEVAQVDTKQLAGLLCHGLQLRGQALKSYVTVVGHVEAVLAAQALQL